MARFLSLSQAFGLLFVFHCSKGMQVKIHRPTQKEEDLWEVIPARFTSPIYTGLALRRRACITFTFSIRETLVLREGAQAQCLRTYVHIHIMCSLSNNTHTQKKTTPKLLKPSKLKHNTWKKKKSDSDFRDFVRLFVAVLYYLKLHSLLRSKLDCKGVSLAIMTLNLSYLFHHLIQHSLMLIYIYRKDLSKLSYSILKEKKSFERKSF